MGRVPAESLGRCTKNTTPLLGDPYQGLRASESVQDVMHAAHDVLNLPAMAGLYEEL